MALTTHPGDFEQAARNLAQRTADLLGTAVTVIDEHGMSITRGGSSPCTACANDEPGSRIPLRLSSLIDGRRCEVAVAQPLDGEVLSPRLVRGVIELLIDHAAMANRLPGQHELRNKFIHDLLTGEVDDESHVRREGQILGIDLTRPRAVILINAADFIHSSSDSGLIRGEAQVRRSLLQARLVITTVVQFFTLPNEAICAYIGDGEIAVLKASSSQDLAIWTKDQDEIAGTSPSWANLMALKRAAAELLTRLRADLSPSISIGIGRYHPGVRGLARSYVDARAALSLGRRFQCAEQVHSLDELGVAAFVGIADERTKADLARHLLSPLDHEPDLIETLDAFFAEDCCPSSTAGRIPIHRNTLGYRLDKIASLTGLDPRRFDDAVQIRLALVLRSLQREQTTTRT